MPKLHKVVNLPFLSVFADGDTMSTTSVIEFLYHPEDGRPQGRVRLTGLALKTFNLMMLEIPPSTIVRAIFEIPEFRRRVSETQGFEELPV